MSAPAKEEIRASLRDDPTRAAALIRAFAKSATGARQRAEARLFRAELDLVLGRIRRAAEGFAAARRGLGADRLSADVGALQACALLGEAGRARRLIRSIRAAAGDPMQAAVVENAIGSALNTLGDEAGAEASFRAALARLGSKRTRRARLVRATARHNLGIRLARRGAASAALKEFDAALVLFEELGLQGWALRARRNRGWAHGVAARAVEALADLRAAREGFAARGEVRSAALTLLDEAELALRLGDGERAAAEALEAARRLPPAEATRARLVAARGRALAGDRAGARRLARRAREQATDASAVAAANVLLGEDLARAERTLRDAGHLIGAVDALMAQALPPGRLERRIERYPRILRRWFLPELLRRRARGKDRIRFLRRAFEAAEKLRALAPAGSLRAASLAGHLPIYEELARALLERGRPRDRREAFLVVDALRARTLREEMETEAPGLGGSKRAREARSRLEALWRALERRDDEPGDLRGGELALLRDVAACEREFVSALGGEARARPAAARAKLPPEPCLAFAVLQGEVVGLLARDGDVTTWSCGALDSLRAELDAFEFQVHRRLHGAEDTAAADAILERLGRAVLPPFPLPDRIRVVLPAEIGNLPIEALVEAAVTHLPYAGARGTGWRASGPALLVGIESDRLPAVARELDSVARQVGRARILRAGEANRGSILSALRGRRLAHLAGHAHAREDLPLLSALRVADGWIAAADLAGVPLGGSLVVLSACRTGDPSLRWNGEALGGFPRALLAAGAEGVVASRWEVRDETAHDWMVAFYKHLRSLPPERALEKAARDIRGRHPHPADWAAFLLVRRGGSR